MQNPALVATKTSILIFYLSLTSVTGRVFKSATIVTLVVVNVAGSVLAILNIIQCLPIDTAFQYPKPDGARCISILNLALASAPVNIITDLAILFLPLPTFTSLRIPKRQKVVLVFIFGRLIQARRDDTADTFYSYRGVCHCGRRRPYSLLTTSFADWGSLGQLERYPRQ